MMTAFTLFSRVGSNDVKCLVIVDREYKQEEKFSMLENMMREGHFQGFIDSAMDMN